MRYLGWFHLPGGTKQRAPWITDHGSLDPEELLASELFRGDDVEPIIDSIAIPESVQDASDLAAHLNARGWDWQADGTEPLAMPAWVARTASNAYFVLNRGGLLVHFAPYPTFDAGSGQWTGSPLWAGFLLICIESNHGIGRPSFTPAQKELWTLPLEYLSQVRPWLSSAAEYTSRILTAHYTAVHRQSILNANRRSITIRKKAD
jgi:hypothetical protein